MYAKWLESYQSEGFQKVEGWVDPRILDILKVLHHVQKSLAVRGGVFEIGVHHGRFFIALNGMVEPGEGPSFAVDVFENQELNIDHSGRGNSGKFVENLKRYDRHKGENVQIIKGDSTRLRFSDLSRFRTNPPKVISIDGGHTAEHTLSDLQFAETIVHDQGVVFLDDILNVHWLGVIDGTTSYLRNRPILWPVFIGFNKMILAPMSYWSQYMAGFRKALPAAKTVQLCGYAFLAMK